MPSGTLSSGIFVLAPILFSPTSLLPSSLTRFRGKFFKAMRMAKSNANSGVSFSRDQFCTDRCIHRQLQKFLGRDDGDPDGWSSGELNGSSEVHGKISEVVRDLSRRTCERPLLSTVSSLAGVSFSRNQLCPDVWSSGESNAKPEVRHSRSEYFLFSLKPPFWRGGRRREWGQ